MSAGFSDQARMLSLIGGTLVVLFLFVVVHLFARGLREHPEPPLWHVPGGAPDRAEEAILRHGCGSCHVIPGIPQAEGRVGPELGRLADQAFVAGRLPNTPGNLVFWIRHPQHVDPGNAMPELGVTEQEARDIAAYLYSLASGGQ